MVATGTKSSYWSRAEAIIPGTRYLEQSQTGIADRSDASRHIIPTSGLHNDVIVEHVGAPRYGSESLGSQCLGRKTFSDC